LVLATGAGSAARHSLGTAVFGGMIVSTLLNLFVIPVLYVIIETAKDNVRKPGRRFKSNGQAGPTQELPPVVTAKDSV
jgi:HAE1 family hydrophobic/amphiphilic exporter-1